MLKKANRLREEKLSEELVVMRPLDVKRFPEYSEVDVGVSTWGTIRILPPIQYPPLKGHRVRVRVYDADWRCLTTVQTTDHLTSG